MLLVRIGIHQRRCQISTPLHCKWPADINDRHWRVLLRHWCLHRHWHVLLNRVLLLLLSVQLMILLHIILIRHLPGVHLIVHGCAYDHVLAVFKSVGLSRVDYRDIVIFNFILLFFLRLRPALVARLSTTSCTIHPFLIALERLKVLCYINLVQCSL